MRAWRRLAARWADWRTGTREAWGGPRDGERLALLRIPASPAYWVVDGTGDGVMYFRAPPPGLLGSYRLSGRRFVWQPVMKQAARASLL